MFKTAFTVQEFLDKIAAFKGLKVIVKPTNQALECENPTTSRNTIREPTYSHTPPGYVYKEPTYSPISPPSGGIYQEPTYSPTAPRKDVYNSPDPTSNVNID